MSVWYWEDDRNVVAEEIVRSSEANVVSEIEYRNKYGERIGYWAFGHFDPSFPYQGSGLVNEAGYDIP